jgi:uncharacterized membrane protein YhaH (DUF805 family)
MKNFIKARLNRDNFWNLMLWFGMSFGWFLAGIIQESHPTVASIIFWITFLGVPYTVKKANKVVFDKENGFFNKEGRSLKTSYPTYIIEITVLAIIACPLMGLIMDGLHLKMSDLVSTTILVSLFLLIPTLYFILKNCPITILFYKNAWCEEVTGVRPITPEEAARFNSISFRRSDDSYERRHSSSHSFNFNNVYYRK